ncbi:hypothetical protein SDC9_199709 [bioreactor metagenome]|uniref:Uncharacterized protein n=1 Tax=bioreactor metagenome TaxID=1076179 RepID=A0A645ILC0_9ZZZZ
MRQRLQIRLEDIAFNQPEVVIVFQFFLQNRDQSRINFDGSYLTGCLEQCPGQRADTRSDLDDMIGLRYVGSLDDISYHGGIHQKILAQRFGKSKAIFFDQFFCI